MNLSKLNSHLNRVRNYKAIIIYVAMEKETLKELGKTSLTIAVAWIVFGIIQPIFSGKFSIIQSILASIGFLSFCHWCYIVKQGKQER